MERMHEIEPHGLLWDRDLWYLVGRSLEANEVRMWRADRISSIRMTGMAFRPAHDFDIRTMLGRQWLEQAMRVWDVEQDCARIRVSADAASRLRADWFYRHATYVEGDDGKLIMTIPETDPRTILPLVRWLGSEAEILAPANLREMLKSELDAIRHTYG
jgi:predicted DNA-binding transcriptional regulator YafY